MEFDLNKTIMPSTYLSFPYFLSHTFEHSSYSAKSDNELQMIKQIALNNGLPLYLINKIVFKYSLKFYNRQIIIHQEMPPKFSQPCQIVKY